MLDDSSRYYCQIMNGENDRVESSAHLLWVRLGLDPASQ